MLVVNPVPVTVKVTVVEPAGMSFGATEVMLIAVGCDEPVFEFALELEEGFAEQPVKTDREETDKNRQKKLRSRANKFFMRDARLLHRPSPINKNLLSTLLASNFLS